MPPSDSLTRRMALGFMPATATAALMTIPALAKPTPPLQATDSERIAAWEALKALRIPHDEYLRRIEMPLGYIRHLHWLCRRDEDFTVMLAAVPTEPDERDRRAGINDRWISAYVRALRAGGQS